MALPRQLGNLRTPSQGKVPTYRAEHPNKTGHTRPPSPHRRHQIRSTPTQAYWQGERIRIGTARGGARELANFGIEECDYGPHEFRYVMRSELLRLLLKTVPAKVRQARNTA